MHNDIETSVTHKSSVNAISLLSIHAAYHIPHFLLQDFKYWSSSAILTSCSLLSTSCTCYHINCIRSFSLSHRVVGGQFVAHSIRNIIPRLLYLIPDLENGRTTGIARYFAICWVGQLYPSIAIGINHILESREKKKCMNPAILQYMDRKCL